MAPELSICCTSDACTHCVVLLLKPVNQVGQMDLSTQTQSYVCLLSGCRHLNQTPTLQRVCTPNSLSSSDVYRVNVIGLPVLFGPTLRSLLNAEAKDCCTSVEAGRDW